MLLADINVDQFELFEVESEALVVRFVVSVGFGDSAPPVTEITELQVAVNGKAARRESVAEGCRHACCWRTVMFSTGLYGFILCECCDGCIVLQCFVGQAYCELCSC